MGVSEITSEGRRPLHLPEEPPSIQVLNSGRFPDGKAWYFVEVGHNSDFCYPLSTCDGRMPVGLSEGKGGIGITQCSGCRQMTEVDRSKLLMVIPFLLEPQTDKQ